MFAKGYTNISAMIETQYGILSHMITDIAYRYQTLLKQTEEEAESAVRKMYHNCDIVLSADDYVTTEMVVE